MFQFYLVTLLLPIVPLTYNSSELTKERKSVTRLLLFSVNEHTEIRDIKKLTSKHFTLWNFGKYFYAKFCYTKSTEGL